MFLFIAPLETHRICHPGAVQCATSSRIFLVRLNCIKEWFLLIVFVFHIVMLVVLENILFTSKWLMVSSSWVNITWRLDIRGRRLEWMNLFEAKCSCSSMIHFAFFMIRWLKNMRSWRFIISSIISTWRLWRFNLTIMIFNTYLVRFLLPYTDYISGWIAILFFGLLIIVFNFSIILIELFCFGN